MLRPSLGRHHRQSRDWRPHSGSSGWSCHAGARRSQWRRRRAVSYARGRVSPPPPSRGLSARAGEAKPSTLKLRIEGLAATPSATMCASATESCAPQTGRRSARPGPPRHRFERRGRSSPSPPFGPRSSTSPRTREAWSRPCQTGHPSSAQLECVRPEHKLPRRHRHLSRSSQIARARNSWKLR